MNQIKLKQYKLKLHYPQFRIESIEARSKNTENERHIYNCSSTIIRLI